MSAQTVDFRFEKLLRPGSFIHQKLSANVIASSLRFVLDWLQQKIIQATNYS